MAQPKRRWSKARTHLKRSTWTLKARNLVECPNCHERIEFYKKEDVETLCNSTCTKLYGTLPMLDLIRDINEYDAYSKEQQEKVDAYLSDIATEILEDIA